MPLCPRIEPLATVRGVAIVPVGGAAVPVGGATHVQLEHDGDAVGGEGEDDAEADDDGRDEDVTPERRGALKGEHRVLHHLTTTAKYTSWHTTIPNQSRIKISSESIFISRFFSFFFLIFYYYFCM